MLSWTFITLIVVFVLWTEVVIKTVNHFIDVKYRHFAHPAVRFNPKYPGFARDDYFNWNRLEMIVVGVFLFPIRATFMFGSLFLVTAILKLLIAVFRIKNLENEQPDLFVKISRWIIQVEAKVMLFCAGFYHIPVIQKQFNEDKYPELKCSKTTQPIIIISNHIGLFDVLHFLTTPDCPGFMTRIQTVNDTFVGFCARIPQCLFVDRGCSKSRFETLTKLRDRVSKIKNGNKLSKIVVFPEGATTNGNYILEFKKGPFTLDTPIKVMGMKYATRFRPSNCLLDDVDSVLWSLTQFRNELKVIEIEGGIEPKSKMNWERFAENIREMMSEEFGLIKSEGDYLARIAFEKDVVAQLTKSN